MSRWFLILWLGFLTLTGTAWAQQKVALVIGISDYKKGGTLEQAIIDADKISAALKSVGFSTQSLLKPALSKAELDIALVDFSVRAARADVAVLYFAGHGMQYGDDNWLIPASAQLRSESHIRSEGVALQTIVDLLKQARFRIVILDACRNNPFVVNWGQSRSADDGLARVAESSIPLGSLVAFAAPPGQKTPDNGVYADVLANLIREGQGIELRQLMDRVARDVRRITPAAEPEYTPRYTGYFSFGAGHKPEVIATAPADTAAWNMALRLDSIVGYQAYLSDHPNGANAAEARKRIAELKPRAPATTVPAPNLPRLVNTGKEAFDTKDYATAYRAWLAACDGGNAIGCTNLGVLYHHGYGLAQDHAEARRRYRKGCDGGVSLGCKNLGDLQANGLGGSQSLADAALYYRKSCDAGSTQGCVLAGRAYERGQGVKLDYKQAERLYRQACEAKDASDCSHLAQYYARAIYEPPSYVEARKLFQDDCDAGGLVSCRALGHQYEDGKGGIQSDVEARRLFRRACDGGLMTACVSLAYHYRAGVDGGTLNNKGSYNYPEAFRLYQKACKGGEITGCYGEALMLESGGDGVPKDSIAALAIWQRGCDKGDDFACYHRDRMKAKR